MTDSQDDPAELQFARVTEAITSPVPGDGGITDTAAGKVCFYCGATLADPAVHWSGMTREIYLHQHCALDLPVRLLRDVHELQNPSFYDRLKRAEEFGPPE